MAVEVLVCAGDGEVVEHGNLMLTGTCARAVVVSFWKCEGRHQEVRASKECHGRADRKHQKGERVSESFRFGEADGIIACEKRGRRCGDEGPVEVDDALAHEVVWCEDALLPHFCRNVRICH